MLSPIKIKSKSYNIKPTAANSVVELKYDLSDLVDEGYVESILINIEVLYTDSVAYQQVTVTCSRDSNIARFMCLNTVPFTVRFYLMIYRKSAILGK